MLAVNDVGLVHSHKNHSFSDLYKLANTEAKLILAKLPQSMPSIYNILNEI